VLRVVSCLSTSSLLAVRQGGVSLHRAPGAVRREGHRCWPVVTYVLVIQQVSSLSAGTFTRGLPASTERSGPQSTNRCAAPEPLTGNRSEVMDFAHHHTTRDAKIGANLSIGGCLTRNGRTGTPWQVARRSRSAPTKRGRAPKRSLLASHFGLVVPSGFTRPGSRWRTASGATRSTLESRGSAPYRDGLPWRSGDIQPEIAYSTAVITPAATAQTAERGQRLCGQRCTPSRGQGPGCRHPVTAVHAMPAHGRGIPAHQLGCALLTVRGFRLVPAIAPALSRRRIPRMGWAKYPG